MAAAKRKMHQVTLYVEVPDCLVPPAQWDWDKLVNHEGTTDRDRSPVQFVHSYPVQEGTA